MLESSLFHMFHTDLARTFHFLPLHSASQTQVTSPFGTVECRRVLGLPPHGEVVPGSPLAAGFSR